MWHRVQGWDVLESREALPIALATATPARVHGEGWRFGTPGPKPVVTSQQDLKVTASYDQRTDSVAESWEVVEKDFYVLSRLSRQRRTIKKLTKTDPLAALIKSGGLDG